MTVIPKIIDKYMGVTIQQPKQKSIKPELPLIFVDRYHLFFK